MNKKKKLTIEEIFALALQNHKKNNLKVAKNYYNETLRMNLNHVDAHNNLGIIFFNLGEYQKAMSCFKKAIQIQPNYVTAYYNLGNAQQRSGMYEQALDSYYKTLELDENYKVVHYQIGRLAAISGEYLDFGKKNLTSFISLGNEVGDSWLAWAYFRLGTIEEHLNSKANAISSYVQALKFNKDLDEAKKALNALK